MRSNTPMMTLSLSLFALGCANLHPGSPRLPGSPCPNDSSMMSSTDATAVYKYAPGEYERMSYYNGITGDDDHPILVYRSNYLTEPFPRPSGRHAHLPVKSLRGVFDTPLNGVWKTVGPAIRDIIKAHRIRYCSIDPARFFTDGPPGEEAKGSLGPVVIWVGVLPESTSADAAHEVSQEILALLPKHGVEDAVVEWREAVPQRLAGPPLLRPVGTSDATHHVRRFLTPLLGVPLAAEEMNEEDSQGSLTLWFHENKDKNGNPSDKVYGISNCHVLRKHTTVNYEHKCGAPKESIRICGMRRFERGLDEIAKAVAGRGILADYWARNLVRLEANGKNDPDIAKEKRRVQRNLDDENEAVADLEAFHEQASKYWSHIKLNRIVGHVQCAKAIKVDEGGTGYTSDWAAFLAAEAKVKGNFEGNVVDIGSQYSPQELSEMFYPAAGGQTTFKFPDDRKLRIEGCATEEDLAIPAEFDSEGHRCLIVGKDGNTTDFTVGRYAGLVSFTKNEVGVESIELGIYNSGVKGVKVFSAKGDSGSLVWHVRDCKTRIVGQLHSGYNKGGSTSNHITYCTPGWYLLDEIRKQFPHADFYRTTW
ncbi:hypothetical protein BDV93DRAFT_537141 [Ceratobasidium sp. AG-I]|nr:hypothetical protein BDV93DRAFT_537141 [Ceratobasidium sp. AG-I]